MSGEILNCLEQLTIYLVFRLALPSALWLRKGEGLTKSLAKFSTVVDLSLIKQMINLNFYPSTNLQILSLNILDQMKVIIG